MLRLPRLPRKLPHLRTITTTTTPTITPTITTQTITPTTTPTYPMNHNYITIPGVLQLGHPNLRLISSSISSPSKLLFSTKLQESVVLLHSKLEEFRTVMGYGRGIAAPQVDRHVRLVALNLGNRKSTTFLSKIQRKIQRALNLGTQETPTTSDERYQHLNVLKKGFYVTKRGPISLFNPIITRRSTKTFTMWDDCMSFPHLMARVTRHQEIDIKFWTVIHLDDWEAESCVMARVTDGGSKS